MHFSLALFKANMKHLALLVLFSFISFASNAQSKNPSPISFPTPKNVENMLFYLQRDPNTNTLICSVNLDEKGNINKADPIHAYWIRYAEKGEKKELSYIQRKFAYGITAKEIAKDKFELRFVSHKKLVFILQRNDNKNYFVSVFANNKSIKVKRLFIRIEGGSFWLPNVKYGEIEGNDLSTNQSIIERINIT